MSAHGIERVPVIIRSLVWRRSHTAAGESIEQQPWSSEDYKI